MPSEESNTCKETEWDRVYLVGGEPPTEAGLADDSESV